MKGNKKRNKGYNLIKKRLMAVVLTITLIVTLLPGMEVYAKEAASYTTSYGEQLVGDYEGLSKKIYDKVVSNFVYKDGDSGNTKNIYTGLAKPVKGNQRVVVTGDVSGNVMDEKGTGVFAASNDAIVAFIKDYPEVFWIDDKSIKLNLAYMKYLNENRYNIELTITFDEYEAGITNRIEIFNDKIVEVKAKLQNQLPQGAKTSEIIKAIHDYVSDSVDYNYDAANAYLTQGSINGYEYAFTPYPVFIQKNGKDKVVCEGYAKSVKILCDIFGIPCVLIIGRGVDQNDNLENHMWNSVAISGKWYGLDATWDDQTATIGKILDTYLLIGKNSKGIDEKKTYAQDHIEDNVFSSLEYAKKFVLPKVEDDRYSGDEAANPGVDATTKPAGSDKLETTTKSDGNDKLETTTKPDGNMNTGTEETTTAGIVIPGGEKPTQSIKQYTWKISGISNKEYTGKKISLKIKITCDNKVLKEGKDYSLSYKNNTNAGKATLIIKPMGQFDGMKDASTTFTIKKAAINKAKVSKIKNQKYKKGKAIKPKVIVKFAGKKLKSGKDYKITYKNNKKKGNAKVIITGKGNFRGSKTIKFKIK